MTMTDIESVIKDIPEFPGYGVSATGEIFSKRQRKTGNITSVWKKIGSREDANGTLRTIIRDREGKSRNVSIRNLMASAFLNVERSADAYVDSIDGDPKNLSLSNIRWVEPEKKPEKKAKRKAKKAKPEEDFVVIHAESGEEPAPSDTDADIEEVKGEIK